MALAGLQIYAGIRDPDRKWVQITNEQGQVTQYNLNNEQFNQLTNLGFTPQRTTSSNFNLKGDLPSVDFIKQQAIQAPAGNLGITEQGQQLMNTFKSANLATLASIGPSVEAIAPTEFETAFKAARAQGISAEQFKQQEAQRQLGTTTSGQTASLAQVTPQTGITQQRYGDILTLPSGQRISPQDPNYATYANQLGVTQKAGTGTQPAVGTQQFQILNVESLSKYSPSQYDRLPTGQVILKPGVTPIPGTVKEIGGTTATLTTGGIEAGGLTGVYGEMYNALKTQLDELQKRGQVINPDITISPERVAEFTKQAETEINPYYASQLKVAREGFLRNIGYSQDELLRNERDLERQYGRATRQLGEQAAETGFALSGRRIGEEGELAETTARTIEDRRRQLAFQSGTAAREYAQLFGAADVTAPTISGAPTVGAGETRFGIGDRTLPLYELSPDVYQGLIGSQEFQRRGQVQSRASELEEAFRRQQALEQQRSFV